MDNNDLWKKTYSVLIDIFCHGNSEANNKLLIYGSILAIVTAPTSLAIIIFKKTIHLIILLIVWFALSQDLTQYVGLEKIFIVLSLTAIFYREIYKEITEIILFLFIALTGGGFLRWLCRGYLNSSLLRQKYLISSEVEPVIATLVPALPDKYLEEYESIMWLYLNSNKLDNEAQLIAAIDDYWNKKNA